jgi:hypothetical protein
VLVHVQIIRCHHTSPVTSTVQQVHVA